MDRTHLWFEWWSSLKRFGKNHGTKWRNNNICRSQCMHWSRRLSICKYIEKRMEELEALSSLQQELDDFPKKRKEQKTDFFKELKKIV